MYVEKYDSFRKSTNRTVASYNTADKCDDALLLDMHNSLQTSTMHETSAPKARK